MKTVWKPILTAAFVLALLSLLGGAVFAGNDLTLFDKAADVTPVILVRSGAQEAEKDAAQMLQTYLTESFGKQPKIVSSADGAAVALDLEPAGSKVKKGSCRLYAEGQTLYIEAFDARGLKNGVFEFLYDLCGVRVFSAEVKTIPALEKLTVPAGYSDSYVPTLEYADTDWISPHDREFALANGLNGTYSPLEYSDGGKVHYIWFCHSLTGGIVPQSELFETHPEYFAFTENGKREPTQLCLSNPDVVKRAIKDVRAQLKESYDPQAALNIVSVTQNDNQLYCRCENCTAVAEKYGGQSGLMIWFVNQIADAVGPDYPDVVFDTFAYQYTRSAPVGITPRDNVCVRLCSIECCFAHALNDPACESNAKFMEDLRAWSKISDRLYVWDYVTNFLNTLGIFPNFGVLRENINTFRENSVVGIYEEGNYYADRCNTEFADLRAWELARNLRNELTEEENAAARREFLDAYYGEGGGELAEIIAFLTEHAGDDDGHLRIYYGMDGTLHGVTKDDIKRIDSLWDAALQKTADAGNTAAHDRIARSRISWDYYESSNMIGRFSPVLFAFPNIKANAAMLRALKDTGTTQFREGTMMEDVPSHIYMSPREWHRGEGNMTPALIAACVTVLLCLVSVVLALLKKRRGMAALLCLFTLCCVYFGAWSSRLFVEWNDLALYAVIDALFLLSIAGFGFLAAYAVNGFRAHKGKRGAAAALIVLAVAAAPYEVAVLLINTIIYDASRPTFSVATAALVPMTIIVVDLIIIASKILGKKKTEQ